MSLFAELKRRNVLRVGIAYSVGAWLLAQVAELAADSFGAPDWFMKMLLTVLALGLPVALFFAWAFELTPEGLKREKDVDRSQSITPQTGRKLDRLIIGVLAVALAYFAADKFLLRETAPAPTSGTAARGPAATRGPRTIAVLPLVNMSSDKENEYFADGLTEELLNMLAKISELQVAGRTSSFAFKGQNEDLRSIAQKLNVDTLLEGSVRKDDARQRVRITLQLINAEDGYHLWSETYDRGLDDIFAIQEEVAHEVAKAMRVTLLGEDERRLTDQSRTDLTAYELYLQGLQQFNEYSHASLREAERLFNQAVERDPAYVPAQLKLAGTWIGLATTGAMGSREAGERARPVLDRVLGQDPLNADAHAMLADLHGLSQDTDSARRELQLALEANPRHVEALRELGRTLFDLGQVRQGRDYLQQAEMLDPYSVAVLWDQLFLAATALRTDEALEYARRIGEIQPDNPMRHYGPAFAWLFAGNLARSVEYLAKSFEADPDDHENPAAVAANWVDLGDIGEAEAWARRADVIAADQPASIKARVQLYLYREQGPQAADLARRALDRGLDNRQRSNAVFRMAYLTQLVRDRQVDAALDYYRKEEPEAFEDTLDLRTDLPFGAEELLEIGMLLRSQDPQSGRAAALLDVAEQRIRLREPERVPWSVPLDLAKVAAARGDGEQAIELLFQAFEQHYRAGWRGTLEHYFVFDPLREEPEYQRLLGLFEADMERQRELAQRLVGRIDG